LPAPIEGGFVPADQRFQISGCELVEDRFVPGEFRMGITLGAGEMRHAAARQDRRLQAHRHDDPGHRLAEGITALHCRLRRQVGVDIDRQNRIRDAEMRERNADRVIDLGDAGEGRVETLPIHLSDELETDLARNLPVKFAAGECASGLVAHLDGKGRRPVEKLLGMIVRKDDPEIGRHRLELGTDFRRYRSDALDRSAVFGLRHREELRGVGKHRPATTLAITARSPRG
jgi:hypothetical protein